MYSRYEGRGNGSSVYMVKTGVRRVLANYPDCYDYTSGITGDDTSDHITYEPTPEALAEMKLTPYKGLDSIPLIRYLYTGREYNIETGDYYYRARIYDQSVGRFGGKDAAVCNGGNAYFYVNNKTITRKDPTGYQLEPVEGTFDFSYNVPTISLNDQIGEFRDLVIDTSMSLYENGVITNLQRDKFQHCFAACLIAFSPTKESAPGQFMLTFGIQVIFEIFASRRDIIRDTKAAMLGAKIGAFGNQDCLNGCIEEVSKRW